jgi:hypothetical protein
LALTPKDTETFYREVDEELRRDQLGTFFRRYGAFVVGFILLVLAGAGGLIWWQNRQVAKSEQQAEALSAIFDEIDAGRTKGVEARLDGLAAKGNDGYRAAALLAKADIAIQAGKDAAAIEGFRKVAADEDFAEPYRQLALIRQTALEFDSLPPARVIERLKPLAIQGNPWFGSAGEMVALAYMKLGKRELAAPIFAAMAKDDNVPRTIRSRSMQMASALGVDAVQEPAGNAAPAKKEDK